MRTITTLTAVIPFLATAAVAVPQQARQRDTAAERLEGAREEVYQKIDDVELKMFIFTPKDHVATDRRAAAVFFFGGGWRSGSPSQFAEHCRYLASRGMVAMTADYRVSSRHGTKAIDCVEDGKSAVRWVRANADRLGIDPQRIAAGGGSAGGHVAACTGVVPGLESAEGDSTISSVPNALILFNPALVLAEVDGKDPFDNERMASLRGRVGDDPKKISPLHHVSAGDPPTIIFHGTGDTTVAYWTAERFAEAMRDAENRCELVGLDGAGHGFFNHGRGDGSAYRETVRRMDEFLQSLGFLQAEATTAGR